MLRKLGLFAAQKPLVVLVGWLLILTVGGLAAFQGFGAGTLFERMSTSIPGDPTSESARAADKIAELGEGENVILRIDGAWESHKDDLQTALDNSLSDQKAITAVSPLVAPQEYRDAVVAETEKRLREEITASVTAATPVGTPQAYVDSAVQTAYDEALPKALESAEETIADTYLKEIPELADLTLDNSAVVILNSEEEFTKADYSLVDEAADALTAVDSELKVSWSYADAVADQLSHQSSEDLKKGELISLPIALIVMLVIFGGFLAASMPLVATGASIVAGLATLWGLSFVLELDTTIMSVVTVIGMGVSVDYGLLFISRYRELLRDHEVTEKKELQETLARTVDSSGRTIIFSALTIAIAMAGLLAFPIPFMKGISIATSVVVLLAAFAVITLLPAILSLLGFKLTRKSPLTKLPGFGFLVSKLGDATPADGFFSKIVSLIKKAPVIWLVASIAILLGLGSSITTLVVAGSGTPYLANEKGAYGFFQELEEVPAFAPTTATLVLDSPDDFDEWSTALAAQGIDYTHEEDSSIVKFSTEDPLELREMRNEESLPGLVTGVTAEDYDFNQALLSGLPAAILTVFLATFLLLFLLTGSLFMPLKAIFFSALSLGASVGVLTWGFEGGGLGPILGFEGGTITGLSPIILVLAVVLGFGLAMDYEVFLISRIKEDRDKLIATAEANGEVITKAQLNEFAMKAVSSGLQSTGRVISSAGLIIVLVFLGFTFGELFMIKQIGVALAAAVLVDMILVRTIAVPATLLLMKDAAWWAPKPLQKLQKRFAIKH